MARLVARAKTTHISPKTLRRSTERLRSRIARIDNVDAPDVVNIDHWYFPHVRRDLSRIAAAVATTRDDKCRDFFQVALSLTARRLSLADPRVPVPVRSNPDRYDPEHWLYTKTNERLAWLRNVKVEREFFNALQQNSKRLNSLSAGNSATVIEGEASRIMRGGRRLPKGSVDLVLTSPPYGTAQKYVRASSLSLGWLKMCESDQLAALERELIGREHFRTHELRELPAVEPPTARPLLKRIFRRSPTPAVAMATYLAEMQDSLHECKRILKQGGHLALVVGDNTVAGEHFPTARSLRWICRALGFSLRAEFLDEIRSRGLLTNRNRTAGMIKHEHIMIFQKS